jgi:glutamine cyclotransferase
MRQLLPSRLLRLALFLSATFLCLSCAAAPAPAAVVARPTLTTPSPNASATFVPRNATTQPRPAPSATVAPAPAQAATPTYGYRVLKSYPHDSAAFTQGLIYADGQLYEGTGLEGRSSLRLVELETGAILKYRDLDPSYFGEGIALFGDKLYQLTWQNGIGLIYDRASFEQVGSWRYPPAGRSLPREGWGLTTDGQQLIMSDGTANLYFLDPQTLAVSRQVEVRDTSGPVLRLNELEYIDGAVYANIWQTDRLVRIDPQSGQVSAYIDLSGLLSAAERQGADVLNGIAYDPAGKRLFVTGKLWPKLFEIELIIPAASYLLNLPIIAAIG